MLCCLVKIVSDIQDYKNNYLYLFPNNISWSKNNLRTNGNRNCYKSADSCRGQVTKNFSMLEQHYVSRTPKAIHMSLVD